MIYLTLLITFILYSWTNISPVLAIYDPLSVPNNKVGIHILFQSELDKASELVNNQMKASWGYVTIPIQATERNREKWQKFFDDCKEKKIIPIIRVATVPENSNWAEPNNYDLIDFANFLNELEWPIKNRYVIIFNEVNRSDEYGGYVSPESYADILTNAYDIFKSKNEDFFIIPAGLDNAASNTNNSMSSRRYIERLYLHNPNIFNKMDAWNSHAYPNPEFSARPDQKGVNKINSFQNDLQLIKQFTTKKLPVFITETGWSMKYLNPYQISLYYDYAFKNVWNDGRIIAITPFLLNAQDGPFTVFSFTNKDNQFYEFAETVSSYATVSEPIFPYATTSAKSTNQDTNSDSQIPDFNNTHNINSLREILKSLLKFFGIKI